PTSGATTVRRRNAAAGALGPTRASTDRRMLPASRSTSARARSRAEVATARSGGQDRPVLFLIVEDATRAAHDARQRILVHVNGEIGLLAQQQVETANERAATGHDDAAVDDVARQLRRRDLQRAAHRVDDRLHR